VPRKFKISIVNYTNTLPFKWALKKSPVSEKIELFEDIPSICAQKLKYRQVDLALVPIALLPELDTYFIETDFCIGADGRVDSVKLYSGTPVSEIKTVTLDYQSRTSIALTKILFRFFWKKDVKFIDAMPGFENEIKDNNAGVVIGDRTFTMNGKYKYEFDLAQEWKKFTGLPFIFAAWVSIERLPENFLTEFNSVLQYGVDHVKDAIREEPAVKGLSKSLTIDYLTERIDYRIDNEKRKALAVFLDYLKQL
jgi:chorismate dehydratase